MKVTLKILELEPEIENKWKTLDKIQWNRKINFCRNSKNSIN